jgi:hypothetical protein
MKTQPASTEFLIVQFASLVFLVIIGAAYRWMREREIARSLGHCSRFRPTITGIEGPLTEGEAERARLRENVPNMQ